MHQQSAAIDMAKKIMPQTGAFRRALNDSRNICHNKRYTVVNIDYAEIRVQGRKMIVCDFRMGIRRNGKQRRFADVRKTDQTDIGQEL